MSQLPSNLSNNPMSNSVTSMPPQNMSYSLPSANGFNNGDMYSQNSNASFYTMNMNN